MSNKLFQLIRFVFNSNTGVGRHNTPNLILHTNMKLLCEFVEEKISLEMVDWAEDSEYARAYETIMKIYDWWLTDPMARDNSIVDTFYVKDKGTLSGRSLLPSYMIRSKLLLSSIGKSHDFWKSEIEALPVQMDSSNLIFKIECLADERRTAMLTDLMRVRMFL